MDYKHYAFSNDSKNDLLEFYKIAKSNKPTSNTNEEKWKLLLPKNEVLIKELEEMQDKSLIDLTTDEIVNLTDDVTDSFLEIETSLHNNKWSGDNIIDSIRECIEIKSTLNESIKSQLLELNETQLNEVFISLSGHFNTELTCKFGKNFVTNNNISYSKIVQCFIKHILIPKLFLEHNLEINLLLVDFLNNFANITTQELSYKLLDVEGNTKCILDNLTSLNNNLKQKILKEFLMSTTKIEKNYFPIIDCLLSNDIDGESIQKLIELLMAISSIHTDDRMLGKLLVKLISDCKEKLGHFNQQLTHIVNLHRSMWKSKLRQGLNDCVQINLSLSQTLRY